jgi:hypothetical protein
MPTARQFAAGTFSQGTNILKEAVNRVPGLFEMGANLFGIRPFKQLKVRVVILRDETGDPLATEVEVIPSLDEAERILALQAHVRLLPAKPLIVTVANPSPPNALDVHCDDGAWQEDFDEAGAYFRRQVAATGTGRWLGYGAPVVVFIVRDISNKGGCSLGPLTDYVTLEARMLDRARHRLLAHEVAHACGLWHSEDKTNLMYPKGPGAALTRVQTAILRNSRHVTIL